MAAARTTSQCECRPGGPEAVVFSVGDKHERARCATTPRKSVVMHPTSTTEVYSLMRTNKINDGNHVGIVIGGLLASVQEESLEGKGM